MKVNGVVCFYKNYINWSSSTNNKAESSFHSDKTCQTFPGISATLPTFTHFTHKRDTIENPLCYLANMDIYIGKESLGRV